MSTITHIDVDVRSGGALPPSVASHSERRDWHGNDPLRLRRYRLGLALWIASIAMLFVGLASAYIVRRGIPAYDSASATYSSGWEPVRLPIPILLVNTVLLIAAGGTMEIARRGLRSIHIWSDLALLFMLAFLAGQGIAWRVMYAGRAVGTSFFYVISGAHAVHALLGVIGLLVVAMCRGEGWRRYLAVDLTAWYLHSVTVLWISLFAFLVFA